MKQAILATVLIPCAGWLAFGQSGQPSEARPKFEAVDAHVSAKTTMQFLRNSPVRNGRYEVKTASMVDLIRIAYGFDTDKILGGPSWLEMDRFDVIGKVPSDSTSDQHKLMLQSALEDRFQLKVHKDTKPLPVYFLIKGKKILMKEAGGDEETGCKPQTSSGPRPEGGGMLFISGRDGGAPIQIAMGPGMTVTYTCKNVTMAGFVTSLRTFFGVQLGTNPVTDETGLEGRWNFDIRYSMGNIMGPMMGNTDRISIFDAVEKQLGLKLEERKVPTPVIIVDSVNQKPSENPAGTAEALPPNPPPKEFEVASIKPSDPSPGPGPRMMGMRMQPGGRFTSDGMPLSFLIQRAFNTNNSDLVVGMPAFAQSDRYDVVAKAPEGITTMDMEAMSPLLLSLLVDRFKLKYHTEDRQMTAYALTASKPKIKKAEPGSRTHCNNEQAPPGSPPGSRALVCQNITMEQFVERLRGVTPDLQMPVSNGTELDGGWDFTLVFSMRAIMRGMPMGMAVPPPPPGMGGGGGAGGPAPGGEGLANASDPMGGYTIFEAVEKQLGLKLEKVKRTMPVFVIDHIEQKPTDN